LARRLALTNQIDVSEIPKQKKIQTTSKKTENKQKNRGINKNQKKENIFFSKQGDFQFFGEKKIIVKNTFFFYFIKKTCV